MRKCDDTIFTVTPYRFRRYVPCIFDIVHINESFTIRLIPTCCRWAILIPVYFKNVIFTFEWERVQTFVFTCLLSSVELEVKVGRVFWIS